MLIFRALYYRNYRLFFFGQCVSLTGIWMQHVAVTWLVYRLTHSAVLLGTVGFLGMIPSFFLTPFAGVLSDRWSRYRILLFTQVVSMAQALALATFVLAGFEQIWPILFLALVLGCVGAVDMPVRHAFVSDMVERREDLAYVIAMNSAIFNFARLIGPPVAGFLIAWSGEGVCFLLNGLGYIAVIAALCSMRMAHNPLPRITHGIIRELWNGLVYAYHDKRIRAILLLMALGGILGIPYVSIMPVYATEVLHGGPRTLGLLMSAMGAGALVGALYFAAKPPKRDLMKVIPLAIAGVGAGFIGLAACRSVTLALGCMFLAGLSMAFHFAASNTEVQMVVEESKRGRVVSLLIFSIMGFLPFGNLLAGVLTDLLNIQLVFLAGGMGCMLGAAAFAIKMKRGNPSVH
ncbi:MAG: MFS transporter [Deltaproteobacteria bacterium]|nr:MFS transporter [Deltaproteobacteria bacterium]